MFQKTNVPHQACQLTSEVELILLSSFLWWIDERILWTWFFDGDETQLIWVPNPGIEWQESISWLEKKMKRIFFSSHRSTCWVGLMCGSSLRTGKLFWSFCSDMLLLLSSICITLDCSWMLPGFVSLPGFVFQLGFVFLVGFIWAVHADISQQQQHLHVTHVASPTLPPKFVFFFWKKNRWLPRPRRLVAALVVEYKKEPGFSSPRASSNTHARTTHVAAEQWRRPWRCRWWPAAAAVASGPFLELVGGGWRRRVRWRRTRRRRRWARRRGRWGWVGRKWRWASSASAPGRGGTPPTGTTPSGTVRTASLINPSNCSSLFCLCWKRLVLVANCCSQI